MKTTVSAISGNAWFFCFSIFFLLFIDNFTLKNTSENFWDLESVNWKIISRQNTSDEQIWAIKHKDSSSESWIVELKSFKQNGCQKKNIRINVRPNDGTITKSSWKCHSLQPNNKSEKTHNFVDKRGYLISKICLLHTSNISCVKTYGKFELEIYIYT